MSPNQRRRLPALLSTLLLPVATSAAELRLEQASLAAELDIAPRAEVAAGTLDLRGQLRSSLTLGAWEAVAGARLEARWQGGENDLTAQRLDSEELLLRWRNSDSRVTIGAQQLLWGRVYELPPSDRLSRVDFRRLLLDPLSQRRLPVTALRLEQFGTDYKLDAVWLPHFEPARLPNADSLWFPIDTEQGRVLGIGAMPLVRGAHIRPDDPGGHGGGLRLTASGAGLDYGLSLQRSRQSLPYYRASLGRLTAIYPYSTVLGAELEGEWAAGCWRLEAAWSSDQPLTAWKRFRYHTVPALDWVAGIELHPGDGDTRVNLQLAGHRADNRVAVLDRTESYNLNGELTQPLGHGRWRANLRFLLGIDQPEHYLNPEIAWLGTPPHRITLAAHLFGGAEQTVGGYYARNDLITLGWEVRF